MFASSLPKFSAFRVGIPRVVKNQFRSEAFIQPDGFDVCMQCWQDYMHSDEKKRGASAMKLCADIDEATGYESDPYAEQRKEDLKLGQCANAMVDSLSRIHQWAIYKGYSMGNVWDYQNADLITVLQEAKIELEKKFRNNLATAVKF
jgi:hypothetical protein